MDPDLQADPAGHVQLGAHYLMESRTVLRAFASVRSFPYRGRMTGAKEKGWR
jgi:hypothetical protein